MTSVTFLLIVLMLTGSPVTTALCVTWCASHGMTDERGCDEGIAQPISARISDGSGACATLQPAGPFLREEGQFTSYAPAPPSVRQFLDVIPMGHVRLTGVRGGGEVLDGRSTRALVLRL